MLQIALALAFACLFGVAPARAADLSPQTIGRVLTKTFSYLPSRVVDALDPFRLRLRIGSGNAASARATDKHEFFSGSYTSIFVGLPGPRGPYGGRVRPPLGREARANVVPVLSEVASGGDPGPMYSPTEYAAGFQLYIIGLDVGLDPYELLDWIVGFAGKDPRGDDISLKTGY